MKETVTNVQAIGVAIADFDTARFQATATADGTTGFSAKEELKKVALKLRELYDLLQKEKLVENLRTTVSVQPKYVYNQETLVQSINGYQATYTMIFHSTNLEKVSEIHDQLTNIPYVQAPAPTFDVKNKTELSREAFKNAFLKCQDRFQSECQTLGKKFELYEVGSWGAHYSEDNNSADVRTMAVGAAMSPEPDLETPIEIKTGKAEVTCRISVSYVRSNQ